MGCASPSVVVASRSWEPETFTIDSKGKQIVAADPSARSIAIVNDSASTFDVFVIPKLDGRRLDAKAYPLHPGEGVTLATAAAVCAVCNPGQTATVKVIVERGTTPPTG